MNTIDVGTLITIMVGAFALSTAVIVMLFRQLLKVYENKNEQRLETMRTDYNGRLVALNGMITVVAHDREECEKRESKVIDRLETAIIKNQDQWSDFQKSAATMEATRGRRLDALFGVVDHQREEIRSIKPVMFSKLDELHQRSVQELKRELYIELKEYINSKLEQR